MYVTARFLVSSSLFNVYRRTNSTTFHRRQLPSTLIALSSKEGRFMFKKSLDDGDMECYFPLAEQFVTQSEPSYCSLSSLVMVLNALNHDPKRTWKGIWRWVSEETLLCESEKLCAHSSDKIRTEGMDFQAFEALGVCHQVKINSCRAPKTNLDSFRSLVVDSCRNSTCDAFIICNFSRKVLDQTGDGHFSPIGGYNRDTDSVLILDVARFKYPPYWVPLTTLWSAMEAVDSKTGLPRGYFIVSSSRNSNDTCNDILCC
mmetsp:Transcript_15882/g.23920  ORF Transcript_15882/g.23920 Transcript_15882/m.23920 type:complete len:259 (+) Transcript_15882:121-897(+)